MTNTHKPLVGKMAMRMYRAQSAQPIRFEEILEHSSFELDISLPPSLPKIHVVPRMSAEGKIEVFGIGQESSERKTYRMIVVNSDVKIVPGPIPFAKNMQPLVIPPEFALIGLTTMLSLHNGRIQFVPLAVFIETAAVTDDPQYCPPPRKLTDPDPDRLVSREKHRPPVVSADTMKGQSSPGLEQPRAIVADRLVAPIQDSPIVSEIRIGLDVSTIATMLRDGLEEDKIRDFGLAESRRVVEGQLNAMITAAKEGMSVQAVSDHRRGPGGTGEDPAAVGGQDDAAHGSGQGAPGAEPERPANSD